MSKHSEQECTEQFGLKMHNILGYQGSGDFESKSLSTFQKALTVIDEFEVLFPNNSFSSLWWTRINEYITSKRWDAPPLNSDNTSSTSPALPNNNEIDKLPAHDNNPASASSPGAALSSISGTRSFQQTGVAFFFQTTSHDMTLQPMRMHLHKLLSWMCASVSLIVMLQYLKLNMRICLLF